MDTLARLDSVEQRMDRVLEAIAEHAIHTLTGILTLANPSVDQLTVAYGRAVLLRDTLKHLESR